MIKSIKKIIVSSIILMSGSLLLTSCETESNDLGSQFFDGNMVNSITKSYDVVAYNISHNDTISTQASRIANATLGAFTEPQFGMQKSSYVTQLRMPANSDFGANPILDSVVLVLKPIFATDSVKTNVIDNFNYTGNIPAKKLVNTYPIIKYGKSKKSLTLNVEEVTDFLGAASDVVYSNKNVSTGALLGTKVLDGNLSSVKITKNSDNSELYNIPASVRIALDKTFFQNKIISKIGSTELSDASNFIKYFKGIKLSVAENDGYIFKFNPNDIQMIMYYRKDATSSSGENTFEFNLGAGNVHFNQIAYNRSAAMPLAKYNENMGDAKLYLQGMGGNAAGIKIPEATIAQIKDFYKNQKIAILSAKIRLYTDTSVWNNNFDKPKLFTIEEKASTSFLKDMSTMGANPVFSLVKAYDLAKNPAYYEISITQTFKDIIEKEAKAKDFVINVGTYEVNTNTGQAISPIYNTRAYTPNRLVLVGSDGSEKRVQLNIIYTKK